MRESGTLNEYRDMDIVPVSHVDQVVQDLFEEALYAERKETSDYRY